MLDVLQEWSRSGGGKVVVAVSAESLVQNYPLSYLGMPHT